MPRVVRSIVVAGSLGAFGFLTTCADPATLSASFIFITNSWEDITDPGHTFSLESGDDGETSGEFTGTEFVSPQDFEGFPLTGSWADSRISFTVQRSAGSVTYSGDLTRDGLDELTLNSSAGGQLTIRRAGA